MSKLQGLAKATAEDEAAKTACTACPPRNMVYYTDTNGSVAYMDKTYTCVEFFTLVYAHAATCN